MKREESILGFGFDTLAHQKMIDADQSSAVSHDLDPATGRAGCLSAAPGSEDCLAIMDTLSEK
ncbi:MAG: hypothetical protein ABSE80_13875 [Halobacteriota archaeon]